MKTELITGYIELKQGSSVAKQFNDTFSGNEEFEQQNKNALRFILQCCQDILDNSPFEDDSDLQEYTEDLIEYLNK